MMMMCQVFGAQQWGRGNQFKVGGGGSFADEVSHNKWTTGRPLLHTVGMGTCSCFCTHQGHLILFSYSVAAAHQENETDLGTTGRWKLYVLRMIWEHALYHRASTFQFSHKEKQAELLLVPQVFFKNHNFSYPSKSTQNKRVRIDRICKSLWLNRKPYL